MMVSCTRPSSDLYGKSSSLVQDVAQKTNELAAGDGTMTVTVLARAIYSEGVKIVAADCNPMDLRRGSQAAVDNSRPKPLCPLLNYHHSR